MITMRYMLIIQGDEKGYDKMCAASILIVMMYAKLVTCISTA